MSSILRSKTKKVITCLFILATLSVADNHFNELATTNNTQKSLLGKQYPISLPNGQSVHLLINSEKVIDSEHHLLGYTEEASIFEGIYDGKRIKGKLIFTKAKTAYHVEKNGNSDFILTPINNHFCNLPHSSEDHLEYLAPQKKPEPSIRNSVIPPLPDTIDVLQLQSNSGAKAVIYINTTGKFIDEANYWIGHNRGKPFTMPGINLPEQAVYNVWATLKEDFAPFDLNITTDSTVYNKQPSDSRHEVVVSASAAQFSNQTGLARLGGYKMGTASLCFSDAHKKDNDGYLVSEICSHEVGHAFGLNHDGGKEGPYYFGHGKSDDYRKLWSTLMGSGTVAEISHWSKGEYPSANNKEDDIAMISAHHFGFREDDHGNSIANATELIINDNLVNHKELGIIESRTDVDLFSFTSPGGPTSITVRPAEYKPNLKVQIELLDESGNVISTHSESDSSLHASIITRLDKGNYFLRIDGVGYSSNSEGYSDYGSLGYYSISGDLQAPDSILNSISSTQTKSVLKNQTTLKGVSTLYFENSKDLNVELFSIRGERQLIQLTNSGDKVALDLSNLPTGIWFAHIFSNGLFKTHRLIIE